MAVFSVCEHGNAVGYCPHCLLLQVSDQQEELARLRAQRDALFAACRAVLDDATGDVSDPQKRLWPIRMENYRKLKALCEQ